MSELKEEQTLLDTSTLLTDNHTTVKSRSPTSSTIGSEADTNENINQVSYEDLYSTIDKLGQFELTYDVELTKQQLNAFINGIKRIEN